MREGGGGPWSGVKTSPSPVHCVREPLRTRPADPPLAREASGGEGVCEASVVGDVILWGTEDVTEEGDTLVGDVLRKRNGFGAAEEFLVTDGGGCGAEDFGVVSGFEVEDGPEGPVVEGVQSLQVSGCETRGVHSVTQHGDEGGVEDPELPCCGEVAVLPELAESSEGGDGLAESGGHVRGCGGGVCEEDTQVLRAGGPLHL